MQPPPAISETRSDSQQARSDSDRKTRNFFTILLIKRSLIGFHFLASTENGTSYKPLFSFNISIREKTTKFGTLSSDIFLRESFSETSPEGIRLRGISFSSIGFSLSFRLPFLVHRYMVGTSWAAGFHTVRLSTEIVRSVLNTVTQYTHSKRDELFSKSPFETRRKFH